MPKNHSVSTIRKLVSEGEKFTVLTAYDSTFSHAVSSNGVEVILVGDSLGMVCQGRDSTIPVTIDDMAYHTKCVVRGNQGSLIMADMPFNSYGSVTQTLENAGKLMRAGAHMVKLEGGAWLCESIQALSQAGIPTCIHMGLTPQSVNKFGGYKVQGRDPAAAQATINDAKAVVAAGADFILLECVPSQLAETLTKEVDAPVIGIGAGKETDGQVLVLYDMLGLNPYKLARFVKNYMTDKNTWQNAIQSYVDDVKQGRFPATEHCFE